jgi:hypothetical protein
MSANFERHFEGAELLDGLLELAGSPLDANEVLARFVAGHQAGEPSSTIIPTLFEGEPQFPSPEIARRLYQNLLGLWDLVASGRKVELEPTAHPPREKKPRPSPPPPFEDAGPDAAFVEATWRYLEELPRGDPRALERLVHIFENRHDALVQWLDEQDLPEDAYQAVRYLVFELSAMLELGWPQGLAAVPRTALDAAPEDGAALPAALRTFVDEALAESDLEDDARLRALCVRGLHALWGARRPRGGN